MQGRAARGLGLNILLQQWGCGLSNFEPLILLQKHGIFFRHSTLEASNFAAY